MRTETSPPPPPLVCVFGWHGMNTLRRRLEPRFRLERLETTPFLRPLGRICEQEQQQLNELFALVVLDDLVDAQHLARAMAVAERLLHTRPDSWVFLVDSERTFELNAWFAYGRDRVVVAPDVVAVARLLHALLSEENSP